MKTLFVLIITALFTTGNSIQCYTCGTCREPFSEVSAGLVSCPASVGCMKVIGEFNGGVKLTSRGCDSLSSPNAKGSVFDSRIDIPENLVAVHVYLCSKPLCNNAQFISSMPLIVISICALLLHLTDR